MTTTATAPKVTRDDVDYVLANPAAVVVLDLTSGRVYPDAGTGAADPFDSPTLLVLVTYSDAAHHFGEVAGQRDALGKATKAINRELYALDARGEIPTAEELEHVLAELAQVDAEILPFRARTA